MTVRQTLCAGVWLFPIPFAAYADNDIDTLTNKRLEKLEKIVGKLPRLSGFINLGYTLDKAKGGSCENTFNMRRARLDFRGEVKQKLDYRMQVECAVNNGVAFKLLDAYVNYKPFKELQVQAGEFKIPFSLENEYGPHTLETPENSMSISKLCNYSDLAGVKANGRDIGMMLHGGLVHRQGFDVVNYAVGVFNGTGINLKDDNRQKDFSGRLTLYPCKLVSLSGSYYFGSYENTTAASTGRRHRTAAGIKVQNAQWLFRSEHLWGNTGGQKSNGVYAMLAYSPIRQLQPLVKYDYFQEDKAVPAREHDCTVGLNYMPTKNFRLQTFYTYKLKDNNRPDNHLVALQFFAQF